MGNGIDPKEAVSAIRELNVDAEMELFATREIASLLLKELEGHKTQVFVSAHEECIGMDEPPVKSVLEKSNSTLVQGIQRLKSGNLDALVTLGSTGAVIAAAKLYLPSLPGVKRPFLLATLPSLGGPLMVADVGGSVQPKLSYFRELAMITSAYFQAVNSEVPIRLGLLNIGEEATKGTGVQKEAFFSLSRLIPLMNNTGCPITFAGNIEPHNAFNGSINVLVTDGFTGNIFLKTAEGAAEFILTQLKGQSTLKLFESAEYSGAFVAGIDATLIKCHGHSSKKALAKGVEQAYKALKTNLLEKVKINAKRFDLIIND